MPNENKKVNCHICGRLIRSDTLSRHLRRKDHVNMEEQEEEKERESIASHSDEEDTREDEQSEPLPDGEDTRHGERGEPTVASHPTTREPRLKDTTHEPRPTSHAPKVCLAGQRGEEKESLIKVPQSLF